MTLRINMPIRASELAMALLLLCSGAAQAQNTNNFKEDFTGASTTNQWYFYNGACLTAGTSTLTTSPGQIPSCTTVLGTYYNKQADKDAAMVGGYSGYLGSSSAPSSISAQKPDPIGNGALRFTNGYPYGHNENGAIVSNFTYPTNQGLQITFKTVTYLGNSGGDGGDGADGMSFFLMDGSITPNIGSWGGSLGYTCSITNSDYHGMVGAYLGLGIDEFGNFLNGTKNLATGATLSSPDNTADGYGYVPNRIGLRGAGSVAWSALKSQYPGSMNVQSWSVSQQQTAVKNTCHNGYLSDATNTSSNPWGKAVKDSSNNKIPVADYPAITTTNNGTTVGAYTILKNVKIANESAKTRGDTTVANTSTSNATPITYKLKITQDGYLSFAYSYNGGAWSNVLTNQSITASNGPLPANFAFGFGGSTGGSTNVHEILCFKAGPIEGSSTSGSIGVYQNPTVKTGVQLYLANYFPSTNSGQLTANEVTFDTKQNALVLQPKPTWDASCVLTGVDATTGACSTGATAMTAEAPTSRVMLTWNGTSGVAFESTGITADQLATLNFGDSASTNNRLNYLRGDRTNEITKANPNGLYRQRTSVLGDIVDSSPLWVGPAQTYDSSIVFVDQIHGDQKAPEDNGQPYSEFVTNAQSRQNVVYAGANDGFLHGFRAGSMDASGAVQDTKATPNDGYEVLAYMPGALLKSAASACTPGTTQSLGQNIHGFVPANSNCNPVTTDSVDNTLDFSNTNYAHNWFVDAAPGSGDLFYQAPGSDKGTWHTWLVGGLGPGGAAIYALDVTDPSTFTEANASKVVIGEWTPSNITCATDTATTSCADYLGNTYGTPLIRRFHNGSWGVIFGNGYGSKNNVTPGVFIMLVNPSDGTRTFYFLSTPAPTGKNPPPNGFSSVAAGDLDLDHIVDYLYAGDLLGNIWRFDVTSTDPTQWKVSATSPFFNAGAPITTKLTVSTYKFLTTTQSNTGITYTLDPERVMIDFGTGQSTPQTSISGTQYAQNTQYLFGIWDWDMGSASDGTGWNGFKSRQPTLGLTGTQSITTSNLVQQTITTNGTARTVSHNTVCWKGSDSGCNAMGWYIALPGSGEQVIFDPAITSDGMFVVNTFIPTVDSPLNCNPAANSTGFTFALLPDTGAGGGQDGQHGYFNVNGNTTADALQLNGVGIPQTLSSGMQGDGNSAYLLTQTSGGGATSTRINRNLLVTGARMNWIERR